VYTDTHPALSVVWGWDEGFERDRAKSIEEE